MSRIFIAAFSLLCIWKLAESKQTYDGLRTTWGLNPFSQYTFAAQPRDLVEDDMKDFVLLDNLCAAGTTAPFKGKRYWSKKDPALVLLFDINGFIAGMQTLVPKDKYTPSQMTSGHPYVLYNGYWTLTTYFVDPSIICTTGRTLADYDREGTARGLWIQNGTDPLKNLLEMPLVENDAKQTDWGHGKCFYTMGNHYWYDLSLDMECDKFFPFFVLYNSGKLNAWGFAMNAKLDSPRYEHPTPTVAGQFMSPVPSCMKTDPSFKELSTMHVYFTDWPRSTCLC